MRSTFSGLEIARSALTASQIALNVTGQNIANVNTENYTRQKADMAALNYTSGIYKYALPPRSNAGQGVEVQQLTQIRDSFLDARLRHANGEYQAWHTGLSALEDMENIFDETENDGLHAMVEEFYQQLQALSNHGGEIEYTNILRSAGEKLTQVLNQYATQLGQIRRDQQGALETDLRMVNTLTDKLNQINLQIKDQQLRGNVSNELLDSRNDYLDQLSGYMDINAVLQGDGTVSVHSGGLDILAQTFSWEVDGGKVKLTAENAAGDQVEYLPNSGSLKGGLMVLNDGAAEGEFQGLTYYEGALNHFAEAFVGTFNTLNTLDPLNPAPLFSARGGGAITAANISISDEWRGNPNYIESATTGIEGDNDNIIRMINAMDNPVDAAAYPEFQGTFAGFSRMLMSDIAVGVGYQKDMTAMSGRILDALSHQRESISGVSLNEETINMTQYEKSFQAAARLMTAMDEALDMIINRMGIVGR